MNDADADIGRDDVVRLLNAFYAAVRRDTGDLGRLFAAEVTDWDAYLALMSDFWCGTLAHGPDHPIPSPPGLLYGMTRSSISRWRTLFSEAAQATLQPAQTRRLLHLSQQVEQLQARV